MSERQTSHQPTNKNLRLSCCRHAAAATACTSDHPNEFGVVPPKTKHPLSPLGVKSLLITPARSHARAHALHVLPVADTQACINSPLCCATSPLILGGRVPRLLLQLRPTADAHTCMLTLTRQCARACPQDGRAHKSAAKKGGGGDESEDDGREQKEPPAHSSLTSPSRLRVESDDHDSTRN